MFPAAFAIGALGSFHCIGMCGPIALSVPMGGKQGFEGLLRALSYNLGRIFTYSLLGLLVGSLGRQIAIGGYQQALSIAVGILILAFLFLPRAITKRIDPTSTFAQLFLKLKTVFRSLFQHKSILGPLTIGIVNGLLPCGLVYVGLAGALALGDPFSSAQFMAAFGLGTLPVMISIILFGNMISMQWRSRIRKLTPVMFAIIGTLFILRGMNLGIPYVSPNMDTTTVGATPQCHTP